MKRLRNYEVILTTVQCGHSEVLKVLLDDVTDTITDLVDWKTIRTAACRSNIEMIKYFEQKLDGHLFEDLLAKMDPRYGTVFHNLAARGQIEMLKYLCQTSSGFSRNPIQKNRLGRTPIHDAAARGHLEIVKLLASYTSNPNSPDKEGLTPSEFARSKGFLNIYAYLSKLSNSQVPN